MVKNKLGFIRNLYRGDKGHRKIVEDYRAELFRFGDKPLSSSKAGTIKPETRVFIIEEQVSDVIHRNITTNLVSHTRYDTRKMYVILHEGSLYRIQQNRVEVL